MTPPKRRRVKRFYGHSIAERGSRAYVEAVAMDEREKALLRDKIAKSMYARTYKQLRAAGYIWAKCVQNVDAEVERIALAAYGGEGER